MNEILNNDVLQKILNEYFETYEESFFIRLVCVRWSKLVEPLANRVSLTDVAEHFASLGSKPALEYLCTHYTEYANPCHQLT